MKQTANTRRITIPPLPVRLLLRERLLNRLHEGLQTPLTIVQAEFGFGKTTILSQFVSTVLDKKEADIVWYTVRENESHLALFLERLGQSIRQIVPGFGTRLFLNLRECGDNEADFRDHLCQVFLADLEEITDPCIIVLDDLHFVDTNEHIFYFLQNIFEDLPAHIHLYIGTRRGLPLSLDLQRMHNEVTELKRKDLEFTPEEATSFFSTVVQRKLEPKEVDALLKLTQGWTGALALVARTFADNPSTIIEQFSHEELHHALHQLIEEQIFSKLRPPIADALIVANLIGTWDVKTVREMLADELGRNEIEKVVQNILKQNEFFLQQADEPGNGSAKYTFNPIFSEYLWTKTTERHIGLVAESYERQGVLWLALTNYIRAERWTDAERVMEAIWNNPRQLPSPHERLHALDQIPHAIQEKADIFILERAYLLVQNQEFSQALALTYNRTVGGKLDLSFRIIELVSRIALLGPRDPILAQQCEVLYQDVDKIDEGNKYVFMSLYAVILSSHNRFEEAFKVLENVKREDGYIHYVRARIYAWACDLHKATEEYEQLKRDITNTTHPWVLTQDYTNATEIALALGRIDDAKQFNNALKELTAKYFLRKDGMLADAWGVRIAVAAHDYKSAAAAPAELVDYFHTKFRPTTADMIIFYRALALYSSGDYTRAWRELLPEPFSHMYDPQRVALKMVLAQEMQLTSYEKIFFEQTTTIIADTDTPPLLQVILRQYLAYDLYLKTLSAPTILPAFGDQMQTLLAVPHIIEANDTPFAFKVYIAAYRLFPELREQLHERFLFAPIVAARALHSAMPEASDDDKKLLSDLLTRLGIEEINTEISAPLQPLKDDDDIARAIKVTCLGGYSVEINGQSIEHKQWTTKNQELLLYFLTHHNEDVPDHDICRALWHTKTIDSARNSLMNGVHTLKKMFADILDDDDHGLSFARNRALFAYKLYLGDSYFLDFEEFLQRCKETRVNRDLPHKAAATAMRALRLCKGDLVMNSPLARASQDISWLETERKQVREQYFDLLAFFAEQKDPGLFPLQDVHDVLTTIFRFKEITSEGADTLAAFISRAAHFSTMRGEEAEAEKIQHAFRQMREMHPSLAPIE